MCFTPGISAAFARSCCYFEVQSVQNIIRIVHCHSANLLFATAADASAVARWMLKEESPVRGMNWLTSSTSLYNIIDVDNIAI